MPTLFVWEHIVAKEKVVDAARRVAGPVIEGLGYELVDVVFLMEAGRWRLRFYIDKPGGVGISDCEAASREVSMLLEVEDVVTGPYALEVSSPGLDRPLFGPADYERFAGSLAKVRTSVKVEGQKVFIGKIDAPGATGFDIISKDGGKVYHIEYDQVEKARLEVEF